MKEINKEDYNTSFPNDFLDFKTDWSMIDIYVNLDAYETESGMMFVAAADDPSCSIPLPESRAKDIQYVQIKYRTDNPDGRCGEMYFSTESVGIDESRKGLWTYKTNDGTWAVQNFNMAAWKNLDEELTYLRFDPIAGNGKTVKAGESVEVAYLAFFAYNKDAKAFNYDEYQRYLKDLAAQQKEERIKRPESWEKPEYTDMKVLDSDNTEGTVRFTEEGDKYTVSYDLNGKNVSYTVPNTVQFRNGPLAGTDDLGRKQNNMYSKVDPDYSVINNNKVRFIDEKERTVGVYGENGEHYVGIFYFIVHAPGIWSRAHNVQEILEANPDDPANPEVWGNVYEAFYFAKPLYGYYSSTDKWVIRKHMELLSNAGVDFLYFDTTNAQAYTNVVKMIIEVCHEMNEAGYGAPKICFYTHSGAKERVKTIYNAIYAGGEYTDTWLYVDGKPLIIAPADANIDGFFTTREPQWPNEDKVDNSWPWIDWNWPQEIYGTDSDPNEAISVSVAQHSGNGEFSTSGLYGYKKNRGRSFNGTNDKLTDDSYKLGLNIQNEYNYAYVKGSKYILVTGWNEWVACRAEIADPNQPVRLIDTFSYEYSRDIEMSEGGYFDNYYMQMASNISMLKGAVPTVLRDDRHMINVTGLFDQWDSVAHFYTDPTGDNLDRDFAGARSGEYYTDQSGRNDIRRIKVTNDNTFIHFYVECAENIRHGDGNSSWMQIFVNTGSNKKNWYGYDYIINYRASDDYTTSVAKYAGKSGEYNFTETGTVTYQVTDNMMMISVPLEMLGIEYSNRIYLEFKVCDSKTSYKAMEQFYTEGDCAPLGRLNYVYQTYIPEESDSTGVKIITVSERASGVSEPDTVKIKTRKNGLKAGIVIGCIAGASAVIGAACAVVLGKKRQRKKS